MSKLTLLRTLIRSNINGGKSYGQLSFFRDSSRSFSTESEPPKQPHDSVVDSFIRTQSTGSMFVRLHGNSITKNTLKTDIINLLEDCNLTLNDVKFEYNRNYYPVAVMVHFSSPKAYNQANKMIARKGRLHQMEKIGKAQWDYVAPYDGKAVLLQGIPSLSNASDIERFLSGCKYDESSLQTFFRAALPGKYALVRFPSQIQAMNCFIKKNKSYCMNNQVQVRVLQ